MFKIFGKHYGAERFFIMMFICLALVISMTGYAFNIQRAKNEKIMTSQSLYTEEYIWSRTSESGEVVALVSNTDKTKVFLLLRNTNATNMSTFDASKYTVFMKGADSELQNNPKMTVYSYANSGYIGFYFTDSRGFANQVISLIIRNDSAASDMANDNTVYADAENDVSFKEHNQIRIYANFGASNMEILETLNQKDINALKLLSDIALDLPNGTKIAEGYKTLTANANDNLKNMSNQLITIAQYRENLADANIRVPDLPYYIANDVVNTTPLDYSKEPIQFNRDMLEDMNGGASGTNFLGMESESEIITNSDASVGDVTRTGATYIDSEGVEHKYYYLHTDYLYPGMVNFEWQGHLLSHGYITQLDAYKKNIDISMYKAYNEHTAWVTKMSEYDSQMPKTIKYDSWRYTDGGYVDMTNEKDITGVVQMIRTYEDSLNKYLEYKNEYAKKMNEILALEASIQNLGTAMTINSGTTDKPNLYTY